MHADLDHLGDANNAPQSDNFYSLLPKQSHSVKDEILQLTFNSSRPHDLVSISLYMNASPGCGGIAWPAGQILSSYIVKKAPEFFQAKIVLEIGSGTGLVGLVAGVLGAKVWITDQAPLLDIMRRNVAMNGLGPCVTVAELNWSDSHRGTDIPPDIPRPDIILAADCVYFEPAFPLLVQTLVKLANPKTEILFCYKKRRKADKRFFSQLKKHFTWAEVTDDPDRAIYNREAISLLRLCKIDRGQNQVNQNE